MEIVFYMALDELSDEDHRSYWLAQSCRCHLHPNPRAGVSGYSLEKRFIHYHRILSTLKIEILPGGGLTLKTSNLYRPGNKLHGTRLF